MDIDARNGVPVPICNKCGKSGHKTNKCRSKPQTGNNNNNAQNTNSNPRNNNQKNNSGQSPVKCDHCQKPGHTADTCFNNPNSSTYRGPRNTTNSNNNGNTNSNTNINRNQSQSQSQNQHQHQNQNQTNFNQKKVEFSGHALEGYIFRDRVPEYNGPDPYCPICNCCEHYQHQCPNGAAVASLMQAKLCCLRCGYRGHTASDCRNPQSVRCSTCQKQGHKPSDCRDRIQAEFRRIDQNSTRRFKWEGNFQLRFGQAEQLQFEQGIEREIEGYDFTSAEELDAAAQDVANQQTIRWPQQTVPLNHISLLNNVTKCAWEGPTARLVQGPPRTAYHNVSNPAAGSFSKISKPYSSCSTTSMRFPNASEFWSDPAVARVVQALKEEQLSERERAVRQKCDISARLYKKENYNLSILALSNKIREHNILSAQTNDHLHFKMAAGYQFWRDPKAMEALACQMTPRCHGCGQHGVILDRHMNSEVINQDVLSVEDFGDWGVFTMFDCRCCNNGYSWVARHPDVMDVEQ